MKIKIDIWINFDPNDHVPKRKNVGWKGSHKRNAKNILQEYCQKFYYPLPEYKVINNDEPLFTIGGVIGGVGINYKSEELFTITSEAPSIFQAEFKAAERACDMLRLKYKPKKWEKCIGNSRV